MSASLSFTHFPAQLFASVQLVAISPALARGDNGALDMAHTP